MIRSSFTGIPQVRPVLVTDVVLCCISIMDQHHRTVQDLPILGKQVMLDMQIYDYGCISDICTSLAPTETFDRFLSYNRRTTNHLEDFACVLAAKTSCEASVRIMAGKKFCRMWITYWRKVKRTMYG